MTILILLGVFSSAQAETVYVAERIHIGMHAEGLDTSALVKTVETGTPLEVLERNDRFVQVRDPQGVQGWIEARYLSPDPPASMQLAPLQQQLTKTRAQLADAQAQLKNAQASEADQAAKIKALEQAGTDKPPPTVNPAPAPVMAPPVGKSSRVAGFTFSFLWLGISFAMLGIGFAAGIKWLRESIRKRSGGMYLRV
ncbi:MAG: TIGR04211 family SH3 domain-containing protein [Sulfuricaulis sp.]